MALRTISNTGGNYNSTGTWVGGVVPLTTDTIDATATSGPLTINVAATCAGVDFTNYTSTLTINFDFTISGPIVLGSGMTIAGNAYLAANGTNTIRTNGVVIPSFQVLGQNITRTLLDNLTATNLLQRMGNQNPTIAGSFTMSITNFRTSGAGGGSYGWLLGATPIVFNGANCYYESVLSQCGLCAPMFINTPGNFTIAGTGSNVGQITLGTFNTTSNGASKLTYVSGNVIGSTNLSLYYSNIGGGNATGITLDTGSMTTPWNNIYVKDGANILSTLNLTNLLSPLKFNNMFLTAATSVPYTTARGILQFYGSGVLQGGTFSAQNILVNNYTTNIQTSLPARINFTPNSGTHSFTNLNVVGMPGYKSVISSTTTTRIGLSFSNVLYYTDVSYAQSPSTSLMYGGTMSNTINFATASFGSGGGASSYTFVN